MDNKLKQQPEWMNANLNTIALNQAALCTELKEIKDRLTQPDETTS